jgi:hypothetical protein
MLMDGGRVNGDEILSEAAVKRIHDPRVTDELASGSRYPVPDRFRDSPPYYGQIAFLHVQSDHPESAALGHPAHSGLRRYHARGRGTARDLMILLFTQSRVARDLCASKATSSACSSNPGATEVRGAKKKVCRVRGNLS